MGKYSRGGAGLLTGFDCLILMVVAAAALSLGWISLHYLLDTYAVVMHKSVTHHEFLEAVVGTVGSEIVIPVALVVFALRTFGVI